MQVHRDNHILYKHHKHQFLVTYLPSQAKPTELLKHKEHLQNNQENCFRICCWLGQLHLQQTQLVKKKNKQTNKQKNLSKEPTEQKNCKLLRLLEFNRKKINKNNNSLLRKSKTTTGIADFGVIP